jgi:hypothetical protein
VCPTSRTGAGHAASSVVGTSSGIDEGAKMSTAWGTDEGPTTIVDGADTLTSSCMEYVGVTPEAATVGTESGAPAGAGSPIMGASMEEDPTGGCPTENERDPEDVGP